MTAQKAIEFFIYWGRRFLWKKYLHTGNLRDYQVERINDIMFNARSTSPFYADLYRHIPKDFKLRNLSDIRKLPIVRKKEFKTACSQGLVLCDNVNKEDLRKERTTGSTGIPTEIFFTKESSHNARNVEDRMLHNAGIRKYNRYCMIWRAKKLSKRNLKRQQSGLRLFLTVGDVANPVESAFTREKLASSVRSILDFNPQVMHGYVSALFSVAVYLRENNLQIPELKRVIAAAEYLPAPVWNALEECFKCPVINFYGASEAGAIACSGVGSRNMTISEDLYFAEVLDENDEPVTPGKPGLVTLTNLTAKAMPFIRFQIGDMAVVDADFYDYKKKFRHFVSVEGRTNDVFELADKSIIFSHLWHIMFRDQLWIETFQVIQKTPSDIEIKIVPIKENKKEFSFFKKSVREKFESVNFDFRIVDRIDMGAGDKFRAVVSEVPNRFNRINK